MTAKELLAKVKAIFAGEPGPAPAAAAAPPSTITTTPTPIKICSYPVDGGGPVFVDISDDGIADIDLLDKVYSDPGLTADYPDGVYKITGTDFGFTVTGSTVTAIDDPNGTGPGTPISDPNAMSAPVTVDVPPPPTLEQRISAIETELVKLRTPVMPTGLAMQADLQAANLKIAKHEETIKGLFELVEVLCKEPEADPKTITGNKKVQFDRMTKRDERLQRIGEALKKNKAIS